MQRACPGSQGGVFLECFISQEAVMIYQAPKRRLACAWTSGEGSHTSSGTLVKAWMGIEGDSEGWVNSCLRLTRNQYLGGLASALEARPCREGVHTYKQKSPFAVCKDCSGC